MMSSSINLRGENYSLSEIDQIITQSQFEQDSLSFIQDWLSGQEHFDQLTSGSTGPPKLIKLTRSQMTASANGTIKALNLKPQTNSLLCINPKYIGGKMMLVRSIINKMNIVLIEPSSRPFETLSTNVDFVALTPHQMSVTLNYPVANHLNKIQTIILGGAPVNANLQSKIQELKCSVYSTYGMTETSSHIALKKLNGVDKSNHFTALEKIELNLDNRECLTIKGAVSNFETVVTNDRVNLINKKQFDWLGRIDNVINSGGIKVQSEKVEKVVDQILGDLELTHRIFVTGLPDKTLGEQVTLFVEGKIDSKAMSSIKNLINARLTKFEKPKRIITTEKFEETDSGKIDKLSVKNSFHSI